MKSVTDSKIQSIVDVLKKEDEFDNKIFIIVSDHGETAMPTGITSIAKYKDIDPEHGITYYTSIKIPAEMSCFLKTNFVGSDDPDHPNYARVAERSNNNLHIWELANLFAQFPDPSVTSRLLTPEAVSLLPELASVATSRAEDATIIAALNGPMAHIYVKGADWLSEPNEGTMDSVIIRLYSILKAGATATGTVARQVVDQFPCLGASVEAILARWNSDSDYSVVSDISEDASSAVTITIDTLDSLSGERYYDAVRRISNMNHKTRSGDIILLMKDFTVGRAADRYTTAYACQSWHGSLNKSDSIVPFIVSYPGGARSAVVPLLDAVCPDNRCEGNWKISDLVKAIAKQNDGQ